MNIPFSKLHISGKEIDYIKDVFSSSHIHGDGSYTQKCQELMENKFNSKKVFLTTSCTHALELSAALLNIKPGDEVIMPSFTFVSTANAFVLHGAKPIFVDIRNDTLNIDENLIEEKITPKTKAIVPVHYASISCNMDKIMEIAKKHNIPVIEDAAQAVNAKYKEKYLGTIGDIGCYSFHGTKNYVCGEGGAIVINNPNFIERTEILREKGTNRNMFLKGQVDKYTWVDIGSSYLPSDILAAFLYAQLEEADTILTKRKEIFDHYNTELKDLQEQGKLKLPFIPNECSVNYHMYHILLENETQRDKLIQHLKSKNIQSVFHYIPLHTSKMGTSFGYKEGDLPITEKVSASLLRLPFYTTITKEEQDLVISSIKEFFS